MDRVINYNQIGLRMRICTEWEGGGTRRFRDRKRTRNNVHIQQRLEVYYHKWTTKVCFQFGCIQSVDWTGGLDYWTDQFSLKIHIWRL